uniref:Uncharacterized protein n=1 Tax=Arundo donax TaxID=35708 RepID=A0A0A8ZKA6_ARUDO
MQHTTVSRPRTDAEMLFNPPGQFTALCPSPDSLNLRCCTLGRGSRVARRWRSANARTE